MTTKETMNDLAKRHEMVGDLFAPSLDGDRSRFELTAEQLQFFDDNGFVSGVDILSEHQVLQLREELDRLLDPQHPRKALWHEFHSNESGEDDSVLFHALGAWRIEPGFHDLLWNRAFTIPAGQLLGGPVRFWHDQLFCKPPLHGGVVAWHQDYSYWTRTEPMSHLTCWIGLDDATTDNGCVQYIPGSHRWDLLPITGLAGDMEAIRKVLDDEQWEAMQHPVAAELKMGQATFHHPLMVHGSFSNRTNRPRRGVVINSFRDGVRAVSDEPLLTGVPPFAADEKISGDFFPLLSEPI